MLIVFLILLNSIHFTLSDTIDNGLIGDPIVECGTESLTVRFSTEAPFEGHAYAKGHFANSACRAGATLTNGVSLTVPYPECDVLRQRSNKPKGIMLTTTIIISFHPMFVTKVDKSYKVQCFYSEVVKTVTNQLDVSVGGDMQKSLMVVVGEEGPQTPQKAHDSVFGVIPTEAPITVNIPLPECKYQVLTESREGEPVKFATVGQQVYHQWSCTKSVDDTEESLFCATVHSCTVREEGGKEVQLLDENGCAVDRFLLNNLEYTDDMTGGQISQVFKFADQPSLFFQCQIRLSVKEGSVCQRSSDHCPAAIRGKRSVDSKNDVDVLSQRMTVFDIDEPISSRAVQKLEEQSEWTGGDLCVSPLAVGGMIALLCSLLLVSLVSVGLLCCRPRTVMVKLTE